MNLPFYKALACDHFIHVPEFITEKNAVHEYGAPYYLIAGATDHGFIDVAVDRWARSFSIQRP